MRTIFKPLAVCKSSTEAYINQSNIQKIDNNNDIIYNSILM